MIGEECRLTRHEWRTSWDIEGTMQESLLARGSYPLVRELRGERVLVSLRL
jgi:hypothetical protein